MDPFNDFVCISEPHFSFEYLIKFLQKKLRFSNTEILMAMILVTRLIDKTNNERTSLNEHRLTITASLIVAKLRWDNSHINGYLSKVSGINLADLNQMEKSFLLLIDWNVYISQEDYKKLKEIFLQNY